jgi:hypothetical protein
MATEFLWSLERASPPIEMPECGHCPPANCDDILSVFDCKEMNSSFQRFDTLSDPFTSSIDDNSSDPFCSVS